MGAIAEAAVKAAAELLGVTRQERPTGRKMPAAMAGASERRATAGKDPPAFTRLLTGAGTTRPGLAPRFLVRGVMVEANR